MESASSPDAVTVQLRLAAVWEGSAARKIDQYRPYISSAFSIDFSRWMIGTIFDSRAS